MEDLLEMASFKLRAQNRSKDAALLIGISEAQEDGRYIKTGEQRNYSEDEALALLLDTRSSKQDYQTMRDGAVERGSFIYTPYNSVRNAKDRCIPDEIRYSDCSVEIAFQSLANHTVKRLLLTIDKPDCPRGSTLSLKRKLRFDGCTGQSLYRQPSENELDLDASN